MFVQGGGCSGFQYGFTFDEITNDDDTVMTKNGVSLLIDAMSYQYLVGAEIDYKEDLQGAQFVIKNPNAHQHLRLRLELLGLTRRRLGRIDTSQHTGASGARCALQLQLFAQHRLARQPGEGRGLDLQRRQAPVRAGRHLDAGQQRAQAPHQVGVEGAAAAHDQAAQARLRAAARRRRRPAP